MAQINQQNPLEMEEYNRFVESNTTQSIMQDTRWGDLKPKWEREYVVLKKEGNIVAAMSLLFRHVFGPFTLAYAPKGPVCNIQDTKLLLDLLEEAKPILKKHHAFALRMDPEILYSEELEQTYRKLGFQVRTENFETGGLIQPRYNMCINLKGYSWEDIYKSFKQNVRSHMKKAKEANVHVRKSRTVEDLKIFYDLYLVTANRNNFAPRPYTYFETMLHSLGENMMLYTAFEEEPLASGILISYARRGWYIYGASNGVHREHFPAYALHEEMIKDTIANGGEIYDLGGVFELDNEEGLYRFKIGFCKKDGPTILIGELDQVYHKFLYHCFVSLFPKVHKLANKLRKQSIEKTS